MDEYRKTNREYLISLLTTIKKTRKAMEQSKEECEKWGRRLSLAEADGSAVLQEEARKRLAEATEIKNGLIAEEQQILQEFREAQTAYDIESSLPDQTIDTELLLQSLYSITGEPDALYDNLNSAAVEEELEKIKREMEKE